MDICCLQFNVATNLIICVPSLLADRVFNPILDGVSCDPDPSLFFFVGEGGAHWALMCPLTRMYFCHVVMPN